MQRRLCAAIVLGLLAMSAACRDSQTPPPTPQPNPPGGGETVTGRERLGWTQQASTAAELQSFSFAIYVDGARRAFENVTCTPSGDAFACSAPLPTMTPGGHTLEIASFTTVDGTVLESDRSSSITVAVVSATAPVASAGGAHGSATAADHEAGGREDGSRRFHIVAGQLDSPSDIAAPGDARILVAQRSGAVIAFDDGAREDAFSLPDAAADAAVSITLDRTFDRTGFLYAAYIAGRELARDVRVVRLRWHRGRFGELAVLRVFRDAPPEAHVLLRMGPDGQLYLALGAGLDPRAARSPASMFGKILRLSTDGSTPRDVSTPVFSSGHADVRGLAWHPLSGALWDLERSADGDLLNHAARLDVHEDVSGFTFARDGSMLVALHDEQDVLRLPPPGTRTRITRLLNGRLGRIGALAMSPDGALYVATANAEVWGPRADVVVRLVY